MKTEYRNSETKDFSSTRFPASVRILPLGSKPAVIHSRYTRARTNFPTPNPFPCCEPAEMNRRRLNFGLSALMDAQKPRHARAVLQISLPTAPKSHKMKRITGRRVVLNQIFERGPLREIYERGLESNLRAWSLYF